MLKYFKSLYDSYNKRKALRVNEAYAVAQNGQSNRTSLLEGNTGPTELLTVNADVGLRAYAVNSDVYTAVNLICNAVSSLPTKSTARLRNRQQLRPVTDGLVYDLISNPNKVLTRTEFIWRYCAYKLLCGRVYVVLEKNKDKEYLFFLDPRYTKPLPRDNEFGFEGYIFDLPGAGKPLIFDKKYVLVSEDFNPLDHWFGMSRIAPVSQEINAKYNALKNFNKTEATGGAGLAVIEHLDTAVQQLDDEQIQRLKREYNNRTVDSSRLLVLEQGQKFELVDNNKSSGTKEAVLDMSQQAIYNVFLVPYSLLSPKVNNEWDKATKFFYSFAVMPLAQNYSEKISQFFNNLVPTVEYNVYLDTNEIDELKLYSLNEVRVDVANINTGAELVDDIRRRKGLPLYGDSSDPMVRDFGQLPIPVFNMKYNALLAEITAAQQGDGETPNSGVSPSLTLPGTEGGRDQSEQGEAQLVDTTGRKILFP